MFANRSALDWVKYWFPEFEFSWLAEEMRENLPKEMNFTFEAANAVRTVENFENVKTSLYIPEVYFSSKRVLIMEYIRVSLWTLVSIIVDIDLARRVDAWTTNYTLRITTSIGTKSRSSFKEFSPKWFTSMVGFMRYLPFARL
jgi:hypothetical protein